MGYNTTSFINTESLDIIRENPLEFCHKLYYGVLGHDRGLTPIEIENQVVANVVQTQHADISRVYFLHNGQVKEFYEYEYDSFLRDRRERVEKMSVEEVEALLQESQLAKKLCAQSFKKVNLLIELNKSNDSDTTGELEKKIQAIGKTKTPPVYSGAKINPFFILNDAMDLLKSHPVILVEKIYSFSGETEPKTIGLGNHANPFELLPALPIEQPRIFYSYGNSISELTPSQLEFIRPSSLEYYLKYIKSVRKTINTNIRDLQKIRTAKLVALQNSQKDTTDLEL